MCTHARTLDACLNSQRWSLSVVNFPPRQIGPFMSEVLTLGTYRGDTVLLVAPEPDAQPGDRLG